MAYRVVSKNRQPLQYQLLVAKIRSGGTDFAEVVVRLRLETGHTLVGRSQSSSFNDAVDER